MITNIDHIVLTVESLEDTCSFYERVLGFTRVTTPGRPTSLRFGNCMLNVHEVGRTFEPKAAHPTPGSGDLCLITDQSIENVVRHLESQNIKIEIGPIERSGARGPMTSVYFRDPSQNLIEVSRYKIE